MSGVLGNTSRANHSAECAINDSLQEANWLKQENLDSIIINPKSLVDYYLEGQSKEKISSDQKYQLKIELSEFISGSELYYVNLGYF